MEARPYDFYDNGELRSWQPSAQKCADCAASIKSEVQNKSRYIARLSTKTASRTINALLADDYGARLIAKAIDGTELWLITGEA